MFHKRSTEKLNEDDIVPPTLVSRNFTRNVHTSESNPSLKHARLLRELGMNVSESSPRAFPPQTSRIAQNRLVKTSKHTRATNIHKTNRQKLHEKIGTCQGVSGYVDTVFLQRSNGMGGPHHQPVHIDGGLCAEPGSDVFGDPESQHGANTPGKSAGVWGGGGRFKLQ